MLSLYRSLSWSTSLPSVSPRIVLASVAQLEYLPPVRQSVLVLSSHRSLSWSTSLPSVSPRIVLASVTQLEYLPPVSQSSYCSRIGRSVGVPPSRQSVCQGNSVLASSSHQSLSWNTSLPSVSLLGRLCPRIVLTSVAQLEYLPPVSQSVRAPLSSHRSLSWSTSLPSVSLSGRLCPRIGRSVGVPPSRKSVCQGCLCPRIGRSVGVPPSRQSV